MKGFPCLLVFSDLCVSKFLPLGLGMFVVRRFDFSLEFISVVNELLFSDSVGAKVVNLVGKVLF